MVQAPPACFAPGLVRNYGRGGPRSEPVAAGTGPGTGNGPGQDAAKRRRFSRFFLRRPERRRGSGTGGSSSGGSVEDFAGILPGSGAVAGGSSGSRAGLKPAPAGVLGGAPDAVRLMGVRGRRRDWTFPCRGVGWLVRSERRWRVLVFVRRAEVDFEAFIPGRRFRRGWSFGAAGGFGIRPYKGFVVVFGQEVSVCVRGTGGYRARETLCRPGR